MFDKDRNRGTRITASFKDRDTAERAVDTVTSRGYGVDQVDVLMTHDTRKRYFETDENGGTKALEGAGVGGAVGGAVGATLVAIAAAATTLTVPGIGLVIAGPLAGALAGGAAGATAGGLIGTLAGAGIPESHAQVYEKELKEGWIVVGVTPRNDDDADYFEREWRALGGSVHR